MRFFFFVKFRFVDFSVVDMVMVRIKLEQHHMDKYKKLYSKNVGPYKLLKKISFGPYVLDLLESIGISKIFNIEDLSICSNPKDFTIDGGPNAHLPPTPQLKDEVEDIIDHQIASTRGEGYQKYLVK